MEIPARSDLIPPPPPPPLPPWPPPRLLILLLLLLDFLINILDDCVELLKPIRWLEWSIPSSSPLFLIAYYRLQLIPTREISLVTQ